MSHLINLTPVDHCTNTIVTVNLICNNMTYMKLTERP